MTLSVLSYQRECKTCLLEAGAAVVVLATIGLAGCVTTPDRADPRAQATDQRQAEALRTDHPDTDNAVPPALAAYLQQLDEARFDGQPEASADAATQRSRVVQWQAPTPAAAIDLMPQAPRASAEPKPDEVQHPTVVMLAADQPGPGVASEPASPAAGPQVIVESPDASARTMPDLADRSAPASPGPPPLRIDAFKLCRQVSGFGVYQPFESYSFQAGQTQRAIVYVEVSHFQPAPTDDGYLETRLTQAVTLYHKADGLAVWQQSPARVVDRSRNHRRDFFVVQMIELPASLSVGDYRMKVSVTDEHAGQIAQKTLDLQIIADPSLAQPAG